MEVGQDGWVLHVDEKVDDHENIAIRRERALVRRIYFSGQQKKQSESIKALEIGECDANLRLLQTLTENKV